MTEREAKFFLSGIYLARTKMLAARENPILTQLPERTMAVVDQSIKAIAAKIMLRMGIEPGDAEYLQVHEEVLKELDK